MSMPEEINSEELDQGEPDSLVFQILNGVAPIVYTFGLVSSENAHSDELTSRLGIHLHSGKNRYDRIKGECCSLVSPFIIFNIHENQLIAMADKYKIKDYLFVQRESGVITLSQNIMALLALDTAKKGERFTLTKGELLSLSEEERDKVEDFNKQTCESLADSDLAESSGWRVRGQVRLF